MQVFLDKLVLDAKPKITSDGYLAAMPRAARTGIQEYLGRELGVGDKEIVRVYRPEEEVFHSASLASFAHRPVTEDHPPVMVDSSNWKKYAVGQIGDEVIRDGEFVRVPILVMDADAIAAVTDGKVELSMGYTCDLDFTPGETPKGEKYDAIQKNIRGNHLAIVDQARGGSKLRVIDYKPTNENPPMKTVIIDGVEIQVADAAGAQLITKAVSDASDRDKKISDLEAELAELKKARDAENTTKDSLINELKTKLADAQSPDALAAAVAARAAVVDSAKKAMPAVVVDGKSDAEIRRQVVESKLGDAAKGWDEKQIETSFATICATSTTDAYRETVKSKGNETAITDGAKAYDEYTTRLQTAHLNVKQ